MVRFVRFVAVLILAGSTVVSAQETHKNKMPVGVTGEVKALPAEPPLLPSTCGRYFHKSEGDPKESIFFVWEFVRGPSKSILVPQFELGVIETHKVEGKRFPTAKSLRSAGRGPWVEIEISPKDLDQAECLKKSVVR